MSQDWRELDRQRIHDLEARGLPVRRVGWICTHGWHESTDCRGPVSVRRSNWKPSQAFSLGKRKGYAPRDVA